MKVCMEEATSHGLNMNALRKRMPVKQRICSLEVEVSKFWPQTLCGGVASRYCVSRLLDRHRS